MHKGGDQWKGKRCETTQNDRNITRLGYLVERTHETLKDFSLWVIRYINRENNRIRDGKTG